MEGEHLQFLPGLLAILRGQPEQGFVMRYYDKFPSVNVLVKLRRTKGDRQTFLLYLGIFAFSISQSLGSICYRVFLSIGPL
eukprot:g39448.t1